MIFVRKDDRDRTSCRAAAEDAAAAKRAGEAAMMLRRWTLSQALAWISTRNPVAVGLEQGPQWIPIWCKFTPGSYPLPELGDAWQALAEAMAEGNIFGLGTHVATSQRGGIDSHVLGVRFPPDDQLGAALSYAVFEDDDPAGVLAPVERPFAREWREWRNVSFTREAVMACFPALDPILQGKVGPQTTMPPAMLASPTPRRTGVRADYARELIVKAYGDEPPARGEGRPMDVYRHVVAQADRLDRRPLPQKDTVFRALGWR